MSKAVWTKFITDNAGAVVEGASVAVFLSDGITPAEIFSDPAGTSKANPFLTPAGGKAEFYADPGIYVIQASKDGKTATWNNEEIGHARRDLDLSDLKSAATARNNIGLGTAATKNITTSPTDSTPGRLLKVGDYGKGTTIPVEVGVDVDTLTVPGAVHVVTTALNIPAGTWTIEVSGSHISGRVIQRATATNPSAPGYQMLFRTSDSYGVFEKDGGGNAVWHDLYHTGNILGTVSQSGGVPTGAIIERGSNVNGEYTKFADGTLICTRTLTIADLPGQAITTVGTGGGYRSSQNAVNFPHAFAVIPVTSAELRNNAEHIGIRVFASSGNEWQVVLTTSQNSIASPQTSTSMGLTAIGRWY